LLVTVGLITKYAGLQLALLLGAESVVLLTLGYARKSLILQCGAYLAGALSVGWANDGLFKEDPRGLYLGVGIGGLMLFNAFWSHRHSLESKAPVRAVPAFFSLLALATWFATTWHYTSRHSFPLVLAGEALGLILSVHLIRVRELALGGQLYFIIACCVWAVRLSYRVPPPVWNPVMMIVIALALVHWWQTQQVSRLSWRARRCCEGLCAIAVIVLLYFWFKYDFPQPTGLVLGSMLAVAIAVYGVLTRAWLLALCGQVFLIVSVYQFAAQLGIRSPWTDAGKPDWYLPLAPLVTLAFFSLATEQWFRHRSAGSEGVRGSLLRAALMYRWIALVMSLWWICEYIPARERIWTVAFLGTLMFLWAGWRKNAESLLFSAAFTLFGLGLFWFAENKAATVYWPNLLALLALLGQQQIVKRLPARYPLDRRVPGAMIVLGGLSLWLLLTRWVSLDMEKSYLTASWAVLALILFLCGIVVHERMYRWLGLAVLACALVRAGVVDVWKLRELYRILSFVALGGILLVVGFIYNKYQEKIKEWL
jgi:hypothetical protein